MKIRRFGITATAASTAAGVLLSTGAAQAQQASGSVATLDEVVVTATKREEKLHDVAMSITAVDGNELTKRNETSYLDFAAQIPGLAFEAIDAGTNRVILRGQNVGSVGATVATTVDDIPFFMSGAQADGSFFSANIDTYDLKRVEVLRGPQGTLYGAAAEGGLIKYVTNLPNLNAFEGSVTVGGEVLKDGQAQDYSKGLINLPFWGNKAALRVSAVYENLPGWVDNQSKGETDVNHGNKYSLRGSLLVKPTDALTIRFTAFNQALNVQGDNAVEVVGAAATPATPPANQFDPVNGLNHNYLAPHVINDRLFYYALNVDYAFQWATLMSSTSYGQISERYTSDLSDNNLAPGITYGLALGGLYGGPILLTGHQLEYVHKFNQELRLTSNPGSSLFGNPFEWQGGAFFTREITFFNQPYDARSTADFTVLAPPLGGAQIAASYKELALFADATYHFSKAFDVEAGARSTHTKQNSQTSFLCCVLYQIPADKTFEAIYQSESSTTWSVAPRWHITDDSLVYARFSTGFRPGGPNIPVPVVLENPPSFLSDSTQNYELGFRTYALNRRVSIDLAAFYTRWKDVQILGIVNTPNGPVGINGNSGSAKSQGLEWNLSFRPLDSVSIGVLGAYTDAKLTTNAPGLGAFSGDELPYVPKVSNTVNLDYTWKTAGGYTGTAGATWTYTGTRYTGFSPSVSVIEPHVKLPTYNTLRVQAGLDNGHYSIDVYADNLNNTRGITEYANQGGHDQTGLAVFIQPRTVGLQLGVKF